MASIRADINNAINQLSGDLKSTVRLQPHELSDNGGIQPVRNNTKTEHWGSHLLIDFSSANRKIDDESAIENFFKQLFKELDVKPLSKLTIARAPPKEGRGLSACQLLTTSSVTLHTDNEGMDGYLDCFVCKSYDPLKVINLVTKYFEPKHVGVGFLHRDARPYPK
jgi:S-adenosylmethionine/arginine decarboxylase-like enzyme